MINQKFYLIKVPPAKAVISTGRVRILILSSDYNEYNSLT